MVVGSNPAILLSVVASIVAGQFWLQKLKERDMNIEQKCKFCVPFCKTKSTSNFTKSLLTVFIAISASLVAGVVGLPIH